MPSNWKLLKGCEDISTATMMLILRNKLGFYGRKPSEKQQK
jgi:hypothetical protein